MLQTQLCFKTAYTWNWICSSGLSVVPPLYCIYQHLSLHKVLIHSLHSIENLTSSLGFKGKCCYLTDLIQCPIDLLPLIDFCTHRGQSAHLTSYCSSQKWELQQVLIKAKWAKNPAAQYTFYTHEHFHWRRRSGQQLLNSLSVADEILLHSKYSELNLHKAKVREGEGYYGMDNFCT